MMPYLLLVYGAAFVGAGFALALQVRAAGGTQPLPRTALGLLAAFALVHGASEWASMAILIERRLHGHASEALVAVALILLASSFALLFAFGSSLLVRFEYRLVHVIAAGLVPLALCAVLVSRVLRTSTGPEAMTRESLEAIIRYLLGIPACLGAALGLLTMRRSLASEETSTVQYVGVAAGVFLCYGVLAGVVVPRAPFPPASLLNAGAFEHNVHLPVEVLRAACAIAVVLLMSEAFIVEPFHRLRRELVHLRADFTRLLAFDLREPLSSIEQGMSALERLAPGEHGSARERDLVRAIGESVKALRERVGDLLESAELETRTVPLAPEPLDVRNVLLRAAAWKCPEPRAASHIRVECPEHLATAMGDLPSVERILRKLLANACEHARSGTEIVVGAEQDAVAVAVWVTNQGSGIPAYELPYVFSRHDRQDTVDRRRTGAHVGLGLHIARNLVESMGGQISVESVPGGYTTFRFTLPLAHDAARRATTVPRRAE